MAEITPYPEGHPQARVAAVMEALETAFVALETGQLLSPSPGFKPTRKNWGKVEGRAQLMSYLDAEFLHELTKSFNHWQARGRTEHPRLSRLDDVARVWLCEQLEAAVKIPWNCMSGKNSLGVTTCSKDATRKCSVPECGAFFCAEHGVGHGHSVNTGFEAGYQWALTCEEWVDDQ